MNGAARRCHEQLEALGFRRDEDRSTRDQSWWTHPADPEQPIKVWAHIKDEVAQVKIRRAEQIAGLATAGDAEDTVKDRARIRRQKDTAARVKAKAQHARDLAPYQAAADARATEKAEKLRRQRRSAILDQVEGARETLSRMQLQGHDPTLALRYVAAAKKRLADFDAGRLP